MRFGVVRFPGSCDEEDALHACRRFGEGELLWHEDREVRGVDAVVVPGGFTYGDYLRVGAIAALSPVMAAVRDFAREGGPVLGICNGFQVLCESHLLPGAMLPNAGQKFVCRPQQLRVETSATAWTSAYDEGALIVIPIKNADGRFVSDDATLDELEATGRVVVRYSGTEPKARVMIEGADEALIKSHADEIARVMQKSLSAA